MGYANGQLLESPTRHMRGAFSRALAPGRALCGYAVILASVWSLATPVRAMEPKDFNERFVSMNALRRADPAKAAVALRELIGGPATLTPVQMRVLYSLLANIQAVELRDTKAALATLDEGASKITVPIDHFEMMASKARILMAANRYEEAESLLAAQLPLAQAAGQVGSIRPLYITVLQKRGKNDVALRFLTEHVQNNIENPAALTSVMPALIDQLLALGSEEEALGYAKLYFMLCPFDEKSTQTAMQFVAKVWTSKYLTPVKVQELIDAQQEVGKPNPLQDVKLPALDAVLLQKRFEASPTPSGRISILIARGEFKPAMIEARALMLAQPQSPEGALQVCRVLKAHDLNLVRANAFLTYMKTGEGSNPVTQFLKE